jgi:hypothetical protein
MRYHHLVRTTLDIDDDVLAAARSLARGSGRSIGSVLSELARGGLSRSASTGPGAGGFPTFGVRSGRPITSEMVRAALDDEL